MKQLLIILSLALIISGCGKSGSDNPTPTPAPTPTPTPTVPAPGVATLSLPAQNAACTTGTVTSSTQSTISFTWTASVNTDSYELDLKNLLDNSITTQSTVQTSLTLALSRNTPYSWYIVSKSSKTTVSTQSDTWKFYNAGPGVVSYAPFPADITSPTFGQQVTASSGTINLTWTGSSVDNNIAGYTVYFGTSSTPPLLQNGVTSMFLNGVSVKSGTTYYWKIITNDSNGNTSDSGTYQFSVN